MNVMPHAAAAATQAARSAQVASSTRTAVSAPRWSSASDADLEHPHDLPADDVGAARPATSS